MGKESGEVFGEVGEVAKECPRWSGEEGGNGRNLTSPDKSRGGPTTVLIQHNLFGGKNPDFFCTYFQH